MLHSLAASLLRLKSIISSLVLDTFKSKKLSSHQEIKSVRAFPVVWFWALEKGQQSSIVRKVDQIAVLLSAPASISIAYIIKSKGEKYCGERYGRNETGAPEFTQLPCPIHRTTPAVAFICTHNTHRETRHTWQTTLTPSLAVPPYPRCPPRTPCGRTLIGVRLGWGRVRHPACPSVGGDGGASPSGPGPGSPAGPPALTRALDMRFGLRAAADHSRELLASRRRQEGGTLGSLRRGLSAVRPAWVPCLPCCG